MREPLIITIDSDHMTSVRGWVLIGIPVAYPIALILISKTLITANRLLGTSVLSFFQWHVIVDTRKSIYMLEVSRDRPTTNPNTSPTINMSSDEYRTIPITSLTGSSESVNAVYTHSR